MIQKRPIGTKVLEISTDNGFIHHVGTDTYFKRGCIRTEDLDLYEWVEEQPKYTKAEYNAEVERLIAERYTTGQEIQFAREKADAGQKYADYLAYVEECKQKAKENLITRKENQDNETPQDRV